MSEIVVDAIVALVGTRRRNSAGVALTVEVTIRNVSHIVLPISRYLYTETSPAATVQFPALAVKAAASKAGVTQPPSQPGTEAPIVSTLPTEPGERRERVFVALAYGISPTAHAEIAVDEPMALLRAV
jgi:hypothetical protein